MFREVKQTSLNQDGILEIRTEMADLPQTSIMLQTFLEELLNMMLISLKLVVDAI